MGTFLTEVVEDRSEVDPVGEFDCFGLGHPVAAGVVPDDPVGIAEGLHLAFPHPEVGDARVDQATAGPLPSTS